MKKNFCPVTPDEMLKQKFLAEYGMSQSQLAKAIGISPTALPRLSASSTHYGKHRIDLAFTPAIAQISG